MSYRVHFGNGQVSDRVHVTYTAALKEFTEICRRGDEHTEMMRIQTRDNGEWFFLPRRTGQPVIDR